MTEVNPPIRIRKWSAPEIKVRLIEEGLVIAMRMNDGSWVQICEPFGTERPLDGTHSVSEEEIESAVKEAIWKIIQLTGVIERTAWEHFHPKEERPERYACHLHCAGVFQDPCQTCLLYTSPSPRD